MSHIKTLLSSSNNPDSLGNKFRAKRFAYFEHLFWTAFAGKGKVKILDLGGTQDFWKDKSLLQDKNISITLLNLEAERVSHPSLKSIGGDATHLPFLEDQSFDLVFSNSVIEHLYTFENQTKMASEIKRLGKKYFVQTPNRYFFIEPHYALPLFQFLPSSLVFPILTRTKLSRMQKWDPQYAKSYLEEIRLLSKKEMKQLFPDGQIYCEKFLGMTKSFTLHNF